MRDLINLMEAVYPEALYHGTNAEFSQFNRKFSKTAKHIYTSPDPRTAAFYGKNVYLCHSNGGKQADLINDYRLIRAVAEEFSEEVVDHVRDDERITALKDQITNELIADGADEFDAQNDADSDDRVQAATHNIAVEFMIAELTNGKIYELGNRGGIQDSIMDYLFGLGFSSVRFIDYNSDGTPLSIVFDNVDDVSIIEKIDPEKMPHYDWNGD
jgi:hypothetical protein